MIEIAVSIISAVATILAVVISTNEASRKQTAEFTTEIAVVKTQMSELTREVREHNGFAKRMPVVEEQVKNIFHQLDEIKKEG